MTPGKRVLLAAPRGYCAGVDRAVVTVEKALDLYGPPVYVRKQIVHNKFTWCTTLEERGAIFVDEVDGGARGRDRRLLGARRRARRARGGRAPGNLKIIDATCPLVTKVHVRGAALRRRGLHRSCSIGHEGHEEVVGTMGEAPEAIVLVAGRRGGRGASIVPDRTTGSS